MKKFPRTISLLCVILMAAGCVINPAVLNPAAAKTTTAAATTANKAALPTEPVAAAENLLVNPGFEDGVDGWFSFGTCKIKEAGDIVHWGDRAAYITFRVENYAGPAVDISKITENNKSYLVSGWVFVENVASAPVSITFKKIDDTGTKYINIANKQVGGNEWVYLSGKLNLKFTGAPEELTVYMEGPNPEVNFFVDDFAIVAAN